MRVLWFALAIGAIYLGAGKSADLAAVNFWGALIMAALSAIGDKLDAIKKRLDGK